MIKSFVLQAWPKKTNPDIQPVKKVFAREHHFGDV